MAEKFFVTRNRKTEQFLYSHGFEPHSQFKDDEFMCNWRFVRTPELERVIQELNMVRTRPENYFEAQLTIGQPVCIHNYMIQKFLYLHGLTADKYYKDDDAMQTWEYGNTAALQNLLDEYRQVRAKVGNRAA